jgi:hypothetical protein
MHGDKMKYLYFTIGCNCRTPAKLETTVTKEDSILTNEILTLPLNEFFKLDGTFPYKKEAVRVRKSGVYQIEFS